jgi:hypothetical protein
MQNDHQEQYAQDLHQEVLLRAGDTDSLGFREECFLEYVLELLEEHNEVSGVELLQPPYRAKFMGKVPACQVNAWSLSGDGSSLDLFVVLYKGTGEIYNVGVPDIRRHFELLIGFLRRSLDGAYKKMEESSAAFLAALDIYNAKESLTQVRLFFITDGVARSLNLKTHTIPNCDVEYTFWDIEKLSRLQVGDRKVIELDFANSYAHLGGPIPCLQMPDHTGEYRTFLTFFPGPLLALIYGEYGQRLLERNVRAFLQARGKVNRGLQKTLKEEPHRFLAYNNGLCCTAAEVAIKSGGDGGTVLERIRDFQIVNGGQTTASIYHAIKKEKVDVSHVVVQVKITVLSDQKKMPELVPLISQYANSQNKVNAADFSANGKFHQEVEHLSRTVWAPATSGLERGTRWYYERARGSYSDDKSRQGTTAKIREWEKQNPKEKKFTKTDLAKFENAWNGLPHIVCLGNEKNFMRFAERMANDGESIVDLNYFKHLVAKAILFRTAEKLFSAMKLFQFRAQSVAYAIAWLSERSGRRINLDRIWEEQRLSDSLCEALAATCKEAHQYIQSQSGNPSEACKRENCWVVFRDKSISVGEKWLKELSPHPYIVVNSQADWLKAEWERVRHNFRNYSGTLENFRSYNRKNMDAHTSK